MSPVNAREIRQHFLDFFASKQHTIVPSAPVIPQEDPTLLFTNAGMNQFKDVFLGTGSRPFTRCANSQKCIRAGGKHNDLEDVGTDTYHHTYFEMLGNWSFGDYFKKDAIAWAWELLTKVYGLPKDRLHVTYFGGDPNEGLAPDDEAKQLWLDLTEVLPENIHPGSKKDNFWEMGDTGPCGPCSEIHVDLTPDKSGRSLVNQSSPIVIEIWNLVFMQFNREQSGKLVPLPAKHVDTGMGYERLCMVLQDKKSTYDTDLFTPIIHRLEEITKAGTYTGLLPSAQPTAAEMRDVAYRVLSDHLRCFTIAIADGGMPSNEGRGYVIRRILRRAVMYARRHLGMQQPFLYEQVPFLVDLMKHSFPDLIEQGPKVAEIVKSEEEAFHLTLENGIKHFQVAATKAKSDNQGTLSGEDAFKLHDTYGFPVDLTTLMAKEQQLTVDEEGYKRLMEEARERSRGGNATGDVDPIEALHKAAEINLVGDPNKPAATLDKPKWQGLNAKTTVLGWVNSEGRFQSSPLSSGNIVGLVLKDTSFYGEQGGQVGDAGTITTSTGTFNVTITRRAGDIVLHIGSVTKGKLEAGQPVDCAVDPTRREQISANHTCTHLLNWALRATLGENVHQKGSIVDTEKARFDFSHQTAVTAEEIEKIESLVNAAIQKDYPVYTKEEARDAALKVHGIRAVFDDQYAEAVRVVSIGVDTGDLVSNPGNADWQQYSVELCGGTHLARTGIAKEFRLVSEESVGRGVRRVLGLTGAAAVAADAAGQALLMASDKLDKKSPDELRKLNEDLPKQLTATVLPYRVKTELQQRIATLRQLISALDKQQNEQAGQAVVEQTEALLKSAVTRGNSQIVIGELTGATAEHLRTAIDWLRRHAPSLATVLYCQNEGKVTLFAAMSPDLVKQGVVAGPLVSALSKVLGGGGGGRPDMAQGGGTNIAAIPEMLTTAKTWLDEKIKA
ncbi:alanine--tRNA ligase [bacterium]|nr:alanine--tRNA ligase [bacterium]